MNKPNFPLQAKYTTLIAAIVSCTSIVLSMYYYNAIKNNETSELKARGHSMTASLAHNSESGVLFSDTKHLDLLVKLMDEDADVAGAEILSADGKVLAHLEAWPGATDLLPEKQARRVAEEISSDMRMTHYRMRETGVELFDFSAPITTRRVAHDREEVGLLFDGDTEMGDDEEELRIGTARVVLSSARSFRELRGIQQKIIGITIAAAVAGILVTVPLVRITVRPIRQLAEGTKKIAEGDLSQRVVATTRDEVGELAASFNQMAVDLQKYHTELKEYSNTLEQRVRERTQELKRANEELERANSELRKTQAQLIQAGKMAAMGEFGAGVAHELNQPLAGIKGYAQLLLSMVPDDSPLKSRLVQIDRQASRMKEITQTMWNLARQSKFEYDFVDIRSSIHDSLILISEQFRQHQIEVMLETDDNLPRVYGDANQLHQVFLNFLTNARDAIDEKGSGMVKIQAAPVADGRYAQVLVMDTGRGIPSSILENIFNPFFTTKAPGKGTGLGLSINYSIIKHHNGFTDVYSEEGRGSVFCVMLPTEKFSECSRFPEYGPRKPAAPCWASRAKGRSDIERRRIECASCEVYLHYQSPPETSLESALRAFLAEASAWSPHP
ncbi:MAG: HAMP domain-containing protein [Candidatus Abyssobacteria bacterium SURF_17]|uniref:histidine kinase n=1 Tax=Candidatus Abyssobacteria bacterium SURF_17 TaxID=2093361 RepID=A0A419EPC9_9BACT|nr:MAG: HAMP domain-containing protein [Candidatus Abyssubacteria bacterium SURF_17]